MQSNESGGELDSPNDRSTEPTDESTTARPEYLDDWGPTDAVAAHLVDIVDSTEFVKSSSLASDLPLEPRQIGQALRRLSEGTDQPIVVEPWGESAGCNTYQVERDVETDGGQQVLEVTGSLDPATASEMDPPADGWFVVDEERDEWLVARPRNGGDA